MDIKNCGRGTFVPRFISIHDTQSIRNSIAEKGFAFVEECDERAMIKLVKQLGRIVKPRNEHTEGTGVSNIRYEPMLVGKGYSSEELFFHTDRSGWDHPPRILIMTLKVKSETGGESLLVDGHQVIQTIKVQEAALYELLTSSKYSSFRSDNGSFQPCPIYDERNKILRFRFDDGIQLSPSLFNRFPTLCKIIYQQAAAIALEPGQCIIADNHRILHGRTPFTGSRELLRMLANPHSSNTVKPILFDVDGTLCRSEDLSVDAYYRCVSDVVGRAITQENTNVNLHGQTDVSLLQDILQYHGFTESNITSAMHSFFQLHPKYLEASLAKGLCSITCPGVIKMLDWLATQLREQEALSTVVLGLLTGNSQPNALLKLRAAGIDVSVFNLNISSFGDKHPTRLALVRDSVSKVEEYYGTSINEKDCIIIGDTPLDIDCAKKAGCSVIAVTTGHYRRDQLEEFHPDLICEQLPEAEAYLTAKVFC